MFGRFPFGGSSVQARDSALSPSMTSPGDSGASGLTEPVRNRAIMQLNEALLMIPVDLKVAYLEALTRAPLLVKTESDPLLFLRREDFNAWNAAQRLVNYWTQRKEIFGERAFLPMDLSGNGAMNADDINYVKEGAYALLANDPQFGNSLLYIDRSRERSGVQRNGALASRLRRIFFFVQIASLNPETQASGLVVIARPLEVTSRGFNNVIEDLVGKAMPAKLKVMHMVYTGQNKRTFAQAVVPLILEQFGSWFSSRIMVHNCDTTEQIIAELSSQGIPSQLLPQCLGGTWRYEVQFMRFLLDHGLVISAPSPSLAATSNPSDNSAMLNLLSSAEARNSIYNRQLTPVGNTGIAMLSQREGLLEVASVAPVARTTPLEDNSLLEESSEVQQRGVVALNDALRLLPEADKAAYLEAVRRVPHLVQKESSPLRMLRFEKYNAWAAASRLAVYWKNRVTVFGGNAFLPIIQTTGGALSDEDIVGLNAGFIFLLPKDSAGRNVVCYDPSKRPNMSLKARIRICFYLWSIICENPVSQTDGYVVIILLGSPGFGSSSLDGENPRVVTDTIADSMPTRPVGVHIIYKPPEKRSFMDHILPLALKCFGRVMDRKTQFHVGEEDEELIRKFESIGISKRGLPSYISGDHSTSTVQAWMANRKREEVQEYGGVLSTPATASTAGQISERLPVNNNIARAPAELDVQQLYTAIQLLPEAEKAAYVEALRTAPQLVSEESCPDRFLRFSSFETMAAARLLALYWNTRKQIFNERAFLPMDQTGDGALERKDVVVLQSGYLTQLPCDSDGRSILCCDGTRLQKSSSTSRLRCYFYMWSVVAQNEKSQNVGYSVLYTVTEPSFDRANKECLDLVIQVIPARLRYFHLLGCPPDDSNAENFREGPVKDTTTLLHPLIRDRVITHVRSSRRDLGRELQSYGIAPSGLPVSIGGTWGFEEFVQWCELRVRHEWGLSIGTGARETAEKFHIPTSKTTTDLTDAEKNERKRRMNVIHSRRKRERERIEIEVLNEQCLELKEDRSKLRREGRKLAHLLREAEVLIKTDPTA